MKEKLIELLNLTPIAPATEVTDAQVVHAVQKLQSAAAAETDAKKADREIRALVAESGHALSYDQAKQVLADRKAAAKSQKAEK
jgi:hypothetical protein